HPRRRGHPGARRTADPTVRRPGNLDRRQTATPDYSGAGGPLDPAGVRLGAGEPGVVQADVEMDADLTAARRRSRRPRAAGARASASIAARRTRAAGENWLSVNDR